MKLYKLMVNDNPVFYGTLSMVKRAQERLKDTPLKPTIEDFDGTSFSCQLYAQFDYKTDSVTCRLELEYKEGVGYSLVFTSGNSSTKAFLGEDIDCLSSPCLAFEHASDLLALHISDIEGQRHLQLVEKETT
jgi:hypothetical protein